MNLGSNSQIVNVDSLYKFQIFVANNIVNAGTAITVVVPYELQVQATLGGAIPYCQTTVISTTNVIVTTSLNNCIYSATSTTYQIDFAQATGYTDTLIFEFELGPIRNPSSVRAVGSFEVTMVGSPSGSQTTGLTLPSYLPGAITLVSFTDSNPTAGVVDSYTFTFQITNPIPQYGYIALTFPSTDYTQAPADIISISTITAYGNVVPSTSLAAQGVISSTVVYDNVFDSYGITTVDSTQNIVIHLSAVTNPAAVGSTGSFTIQTMDASQNIIDEISSGVTLTISNPGTLTINSFSFSSYVVDALFYITLDLTTSVMYTSGGYIEVTGQTNYITTSFASCTSIIGFSSGFSSGCVNSPTETIKFTKDLGTTSSQTFIINGFVQPLAVMTVDSFKVYYKNANNAVAAQVTTGLGYTTTGGTCSVSSASRDTSVLTVGLTTAIYTITFSCTHRLTYQGSFIFLIPPGQIAYNSATTCTDASSTALTCTITSLSTGTQVEIPVVNWCGSGTSDCTAGTSNTFNLINAENPGYIESPVSTSIELNSYNIIQSTTYSVDTMATSPIVEFSNSLTPGAISVTSITVSGSLKTGGVPTYQFDFTAATAITSGGYIKITMPGLTVYDPSTTLSCSSTIGTGTCTYTTTTNDPVDIDTISWTAVCPSGCSAGTAYTLGATTFTNPFSTLANSNDQYTFQTYTSAGYLIDEGTYTQSMITLTHNDLTASISSPTSPIVVGQTTTYIININNPNNQLPLYSSGSGGTLVITPPPEIQIMSNTCSAQSTSITLTCTVTSTSYITVTSPSTLPVNSAITVSLPNNVRNPQTGATSSSFTIESFYLGTNSIDKLDTATAPLTVQCDTPNALLSASSTRSATTVSQSPITLTLSFTTTNPVPNGAEITFKIPVDQAVYNSGTWGTLTDPTWGNAISQVGTTTAGTTYTEFTLQEWCTSGSGCAAGTTFTVVVSGFDNPPTTVASTTSIILELKTSGGDIIDEVSSGLFTLPYVNEGPLTITSFTRSGDTVGQSATYTIAFTTHNTAGSALTTGNAYVYINFPVGFIYDIGSASTCQIQIPGASSYATTTCNPTTASDTVQYMGNYVQVLTAEMFCTGACVQATSYLFQFSGYVNPFSTKSVAGGVITVATQVQSGAQFQVKNSVDLTIGTTTFNSYTPSTITKNSITRSPTTVGDSVVITFDLTLPTRLQKNGYIFIDIPSSQYTANGANIYYSPYYSGAYQTSIAATVLSSSSTYVSLQMQEWCNNGGTYCPINTNLRFQITSGFNNLRYVNTATNYFTMETKTSDQLGTSDQMLAAQLIETDNALTTASGSITSVSLDSTLVGESVALTAVMTFGTSIYSTDVVTLTFSAEFVRSDAGSLTCADGSSVTKSCTATSTSNVINSIAVSAFCSTTCSSSTSYTIVASNCVNLLEVKAYSGTMTMSTATSGGYSISTATYTLSSISTITVNTLSAVITRASALQGVTTDFTIAITPAGWTETGSTIDMRLPTDSILYLTGSTAFTSSSGTLTSQSATASYQLASATIWACTSSNCQVGSTFSTTLSSSMNPYITTNAFNNYDFKMYAASGNPSFVSTTPLVATPALEISPLTNVLVSQQGYVVNTAPVYTISFTTTTVTPAGGYFEVIFPSGRVYPDSASTITSSSGTISASSTQPFTLKIWDCTTDCPIGTYSFTISGGMVNPPAVTGLITGSFTISSISTAGYYINQGTFANSGLQDIQPAAITATVTRALTTLGVQNQYTVDFTTATDLTATDYYRFVVPADQISMATSPDCTDANTFFSYVCTQSFVDYQGNIWLDMVVGSTVPAGTAVSIVLGKVSNPTLLTANNVTSTWQIYTMNSAKQAIDCACSNVQAQPDLVGISVIIQNAQIDEAIVNTYTFFRIQFQPGAAFTDQAIFDIFLPDQLFKYRQLDICFWATIINITVKCEFTNYNSGYIYQVRLTTPCQPTCSAATSYTYMIPVTTRPDEYQVGGLFQVITRYSNLDVGQGYYANGLSVRAATILNFTVYNENCDQVQQFCNLHLTFRPINNIPSSSDRGRVYVTIPRQITRLKSCDFFIQLNNYNTKCDIYPEASVMTLHYTLDVSLAGQNLSVIIYSVRNPPSTAPTDYFTLQSQWDVFGTGTYYNIDTNFTGVYYKVNEPYPFESLSVVRSGMTNNTGYLTGEKTQLTFTIGLHHALDFSAQFQFQVPNYTIVYTNDSDINYTFGLNASQVYVNPNPNSYTCYEVDKYDNRINQLFCRYNKTNQTVSVLNYCYVANCGAYDIVRFKVYDDFITNWNYVVYPLDEKNNSLKVFSTTANGHYFIDGQTTGVFITPSLQPDELIMPVPQIIRTGNTVYQDIQWIISFQVNVNPIPRSGYITITIPQEVLYPVTNYSIELSDYTTNDVFKNFTTEFAEDGSITKITLYQFCNRTNATFNLTNCSIGTGYTLAISKIQNPPAVINVEEPIVIETWTREGYAIEKGVPPGVNELFPQLLPFTITDIDIKPMNPIPRVVTDYQVIFNNNGKIDYGANSSVLVTFPQEVTLIQSNSTFRSKSRGLAIKTRRKDISTNRCSSLFEPYLNVTCEEDGDNSIRVYGLFANDIQQYGVLIKNVRNPSYNITTSPMVAYVMNEKNQTVATRTTQTRIPIYPVTQDTGCSKVCGTCSGNNATCTSCDNPSPYPILKDYTCVSDCGSGYFFTKHNLQCHKCHISCEDCYGPGNNKCLKCSSQYFMENGVCKTQCTNGNLQNSTTRQCVSPSSECNRTCKTCSADPNYCLSCRTAKNARFPVYDPTNGKCIKNDESLCNSSNSDGFYINQTSKTCQECNKLCKTCSQEDKQCYSCWDFQTKSIINDLYQTCVDSCGLGTWYDPASNICSWCNPVCIICDSHMPDRCLTCNNTPEGKQLFLYENQCVIDCPSTYEKNSISYTCDPISMKYFSFAFFFVGGSVIVIVLLLILSSICSLCTNKIFDLLYALLSFVESFNRACIIGNLWVNASVFTLAISFMNLIGTAAVGVFFIFLFMSPIYAHSPHFRTLNKQHGCAYSTVSFFSSLAGVNLMRLLTSRFFGCKSLSSDLNQYRFYLEPLNTMANFTVLFSFAQGGICAYILLFYQSYTQIFVFAAFGAFNNAVFLLLQLFKHLGTRTFMIKEDQEKRAKLNNDRNAY